MHNKLLAAALLLAGASLAAGPFQAAQAAQRGQINITGKVIDTTCTVDTGSTSVNVPLSPIDKSLLADPGSYSGINTPFQVKVTGCFAGNPATSAGVVSMAFIADANVDMNGNLNNSGSAGNVAVQLLDKAQQPINIRTDSYAAQIARGEAVTASGEVNLKYFARYFSALGGASAGDVVAQA
ncbi:fimbrial protein, partial [Pseudomonas citronellolis]|uniref:fimbrial protein n=1 Tax=Pseudomonas citronellolis TaxID=53408 RepID=UPI0023E410EC